MAAGDCGGRRRRGSWERGEEFVEGGIVGGRLGEVADADFAFAGREWVGLEMG